ncbi:hypothetical protein BZA05DRAFT_420472 [Tricharina praecox]|uniref:uncharacterized protein n=1 Tax=Tricharina praecox TaxID=43433 RepID=UPI00221FB7DA|nr:uncharacterized protein BZA05DRAFT_420472 [Tricharina praecox]KAI5848186.1 hypothetical protein BZA05DRAFT_420472 [Tricharina praecox]
MGAGLRAFCFFFSVLLSRTIRKRFAGFLRRGLQAIDFLTFWFPARVAGTGGSILMGKSLRGRAWGSFEGPPEPGGVGNSAGDDESQKDARASRASASMANLDLCTCKVVVVVLVVALAVVETQLMSQRKRRLTATCAPRVRQPETSSASTIRLEYVRYGTAR